MSESAGPPSRGRFAALLATIAVAAVGVGIAIGVAVANGDDSSTALPPGSPSSINSGTPASGNTAQQGNGRKGGKKGKKQGQHGAGKATRGTITAESGATWTVKTQQGRSVRVTIGSTTKFGTQKAPADKSTFPVGTKVAVVGTTATTGSSTVTAVRIRAARSPGTQPGAKPGGEQGGSGSPSPSASPSPSSS